MAADNNLGALNSILHIKTDPSEIAAAQQQLNAIFGTAQQGLNVINDGIAKIQKVTSLGILGSGLAGIVHQVFQTRSYFQDAASSMKTFLGDAEKAAEFTKELQDYAFYNMFEFQDLVGVSKQLIAYGTTDTKEIIKVTDQLSNIATGTGASIYDMVNIYNKVKAQGKLQGDELNQLASRGLVVKDVLKEMGETVNGNNVTFEQFQKVLTHVTSEGGMFHDLMKDQLNNLSASAAQLSDVMTNMWNEIGEVAEPYMKEAIDLASMVVENYKEVAAILFDIAKAYGAYKLASKFQDWNSQSLAKDQASRYEQEKAALEKLTEAKEEAADADLKERVAKGELTTEQAKEIALIRAAIKEREKELNVTKTQAENEVRDTERKIAANEKEIAKIQAKIRQLQSLQNMSAKSGDMTAYKSQAADIAELQAQEKKIAATNTETLAKQKEAAAERANTAAKQLNEIQTGRNRAAELANAQATNFTTRARLAAGAALKGIGSNIVSMINPVGLLVTALGFLAQEFVAVYRAGSLSEQAENRLREAQEEASKETVEQMQNLSQYSTTIKNLTGPSEEYAKKLKTLKEGTKEYNDTAEKAKIVNAQLGEAKKGLNEMTKKYQITTEETVNGIKQEMSALDLVTKKYDEYKQKIQDVSNFKAYTNFVEAEKKRAQEAITDYTSYLREDMYDVLLRGLKGDARGAKIAEIEQAIEEFEIGIMENGRAPLGGAYKKLMDEYMAEMKAQDNTIKGAVKNAGKAFMRMYQEAKDAVGGDLTWKEWWENMQQNGLDYAGGYVTYLENKAEEIVAVSASAQANARKIFTVTTDPLAAAEEEEKKKNASRYKTKIQNDKSVQANYIKEYAKLAEERYKALKKIDAQFTLSDEEKEYRKQKVNESFDFKLNKIDTSKLKKEEVSQLNDLYNNAMSAANDMAVADAHKELDRLREQIAAIQKERETILNTEKLTDDKGNNLTGEDKKKYKDAQTAKANEKSAEIAKLTAQMLAYENVVQRSIDAEINFSRIHAITKQENEKFLDGQVKKQQQIAENYKKLRQELLYMFNDKQLTKEQYDQMSFQLNLNEEKERQQEYINIYGGYYQKREELTRQWEQRLANVPPEYFNIAKQKMVEELSKMNFDQFKQNLNWEAIFGDLTKQTAKVLTQNLNDLKAAFNAQKGSMGIEEIKTVQEAISKLNDELAKRNPWKAMVQAAKDLKDTHKNIPELEEKQKKAVEELTKAEEEYQKAVDERDAVVSAIQSGIIEGAEAQEQLAHADEAVAVATKDLNDKEQQLKNTNEELNIETDKAAKAQLRLGEGWKQVGVYISEAGSVLSQIGDALGEDGEQLKEIGDVMSTIGSTLTQTISSLGNPTQAISQAINATVQMVSNVIASRKKAKKEQEEWAKSQRAFITNMKLAEIEKTRLKTKDSGNWVRDYVSEAADAAKAYTEAQSNLYKKMTELSENGKAKLGMREKIDWGTVGKNTALGAGAGAAIGSIIPGVGTAIGAAVGSVVGAVGGFISGLFSKKNKKVWGDLMTQFPELIERAENGEERINMEMAEQLISQGMVNDATKEMIEDAMKYQEEMDKAREQIEEIADSLMGSLGDNLRSALVDAFVAGEDAAEALHKTVNATLEDMITQLLYGARLAPIFEKIKTAIADSLQGGGGAMEIVDIIDQYYGELSTASDQFTSDMETLQKYGDERGWDFFKGDTAERQGVSGGIANVTQDTAEEMNGRLTQIQSHTFSINENMKLMVNMQTTQLAILQGIHTDTGQLHAIRADIASVKATVADIQIRGLKLKE